MISCSFFSPTACLHVACVVQQKDARQWFAELSVDMDKVRTASPSKIMLENLILLKLRHIYMYLLTHVKTVLRMCRFAEPFLLLTALY